MRPAAFLLIILFGSAAAALRLPPALRQQARRGACCTRRAAVEFGALAALSLPSGAAVASGGATAGKTTSIPRAKVHAQRPHPTPSVTAEPLHSLPSAHLVPQLRYYDRVTAAVAAFQGLGTTIKGGGGGEMKTAAASFFSDRDESPLSEFKSAGYLLAVAFKIDSKIPPDKIQQVKDYKKFMKDLDGLKSAMGKGKQSESATAFAAASNSLNVLLEGVELPPTGDVRYS